jgi:hypothetical protein
LRTRQLFISKSANLGLIFRDICDPELGLADGIEAVLNELGEVGENMAEMIGKGAPGEFFLWFFGGF